LFFALFYVLKIFVWPNGRFLEILCVFAGSPAPTVFQKLLATTVSSNFHHGVCKTY
jgi:hypothetical protein